MVLQELAVVGGFSSKKQGYKAGIKTSRKRFCRKGICRVLLIINQMGGKTRVEMRPRVGRGRGLCGTKWYTQHGRLCNKSD